MPSRRSRLFLLFLALASSSFLGCGLARPSKLLGRWYNGDVSIRFRENGSVLYNSQNTGLVEGIYRYDSSALPIASTKPVKNLTLWLPQPGTTLVLDFELRYLGDQRIQIRPIFEKSDAPQDPAALAALGVILKKAASDAPNTDGLDTAPPIASANPAR